MIKFIFSFSRTTVCSVFPYIRQIAMFSKLQFVSNIDKVNMPSISLLIYLNIVLGILTSGFDFPVENSLNDI